MNTYYFTTRGGEWRVTNNGDGTANVIHFYANNGGTSTYENVTIPRDPVIGRAFEIVTRHGRSLATSPVIRVWTRDITDPPPPTHALAHALHDTLVNIYA